MKKGASQTIKNIFCDTPFSQYNNITPKDAVLPHAQKYLHTHNNK